MALNHSSEGYRIGGRAVVWFGGEGVRSPGRKTPLGADGWRKRTPSRSQQYPRSSAGFWRAAAPLRTTRANSNKLNGTAASQVNFWSPHNEAQKRSVSAMFSGVQAAAPDNSSRRDWVNESTSSTSLAEGLILSCTSRWRRTIPRSI